MTPEELDLIHADGDRLRADADAFSSIFYDTLFEIAPATRRLFPDDLVTQRGKLVDELGFLVDTATASRSAGELGPFLDRARDLGRRHAGYGVGGADYEPVRVGLIAALRDTVDGWDDEHESSWNKLFRLIADVMREGAEAASRPTS